MSDVQKEPATVAIDRYVLVAILVVGIVGLGLVIAIILAVAPVSADGLSCGNALSPDEGFLVPYDCGKAIESRRLWAWAAAGFGLVAAVLAWVYVGPWSQSTPTDEATS